MESGIQIDIIFEQPWNAPLPIVHTETGIDISVSPEQSLKAFAFIETVFGGSVIEDRWMQPLKASSPMIVTESPIDTYLRLDLLYWVTQNGDSLEFQKSVSTLEHS